MIRNISRCSGSDKPNGVQQTKHRQNHFHGLIAGVSIAVCAYMMMCTMMVGGGVVADEPGASKTDPRLAGIWVIESGVNNGQPISDQELEGARTIVRENAIVSYDRDAKIKYRCLYYFDESKTPNTIDMVSTMQRDNDAKAPGIYKVENSSWTLCYNYGGTERPEKFESKEGSKLMLLKLKRLKDTKN